MNFKGFKDKYEKKAVTNFNHDFQDEIMVSISVVTFQHKEFIKDCLEGILMQETSFSFEILLGEDGSTDGTREICLEYAKKYPDKIRLFLHHRENNIAIEGKPTGRFNFLYNLYNARGKYFAICEGDDYWTDPLKLQKQIDFLEKNKSFFVCFHNVEIWNVRKGKNVRQPMLKKLQRDVFTTKDLLKQWFIPTGSIVFRKKRLNIPEWFSYCSSGDILLLLILSLNGKIKFLNEVMGVYRLHDSGISVQHAGYRKVFSMIYLYQNFDVFTNFKFHQEIRTAMVYETRKHLPEAIELNRIKNAGFFRGFKLLVTNKFSKVKK